MYVQFTSCVYKAQQCIGPGDFYAGGCHAWDEVISKGHFYETKQSVPVKTLC